MPQVNQNKSARSATTDDIVRVIHKVEAMRARHAAELSGLVDELRAYLPAHEDHARYQRIRAICSSRAAIRADLRGGLKS
jgi:hypothetical protein